MPDAALIKAVARPQFDDLVNGRSRSFADLAKAVGCSERHVSRLMPLTSLAAEIGGSSSRRNPAGRPHRRDFHRGMPTCPRLGRPDGIVWFRSLNSSTADRTVALGRREKPRYRRFEGAIRLSPGRLCPHNGPQIAAMCSAGSHPTGEFKKFRDLLAEGTVWCEPVSAGPNSHI